MGYMIIYNALLYFILIVFSPLLLLVLLLDKKYRTGLKGRLGILPRDFFEKVKDKKIIWFHSASVGEVQALAPVVKELRKMFAEDYCFIATATTSTGKNKIQEELAGIITEVLFFPLDINPISFKLLEKIKPEMIVIVETEFWPNFIYSAGLLKIPVILINGRISNKSFKVYKFFAFFFIHILSKFTFFIMQSEKMLLRLMALGIKKNKITVMTNTKYSIQVGKKEVGKLALKNKKIKTAIFGSIRDGEEDIVIDAYKIMKRKDVCFIIAPRHMKRVKKIEKLLKKSKLNYVLWKGLRDKREMLAPGIVVVNTIGELNRIYTLGDAAVIGGAFKNFGGHNPMEAAAAGLPIIMGKHMYNFEDTADKFVKAGGAIQINTDAGELATALGTIFDNKKVSADMVKASLEVVEKHKGSALKTALMVKKIIVIKEAPEQNSGGTRYA